VAIPPTSAFYAAAILTHLKRKAYFLTFEYTGAIIAFVIPLALGFQAWPRSVGKSGHECHRQAGKVESQR
jgi:hypothetical protein